MMALISCSRRLLPYKKTIYNSIRHNGYIVLVPEIGEDLPEKNPLLQNDGLPEFNNLTIENCMAAIAKQTLEFEDGVKRIEHNLQNKADVNVFDDIFKPLEELSTPLDTTWGLSKTLYLGNSILMPTKSYLAIHDRAKRARAVKFNSPPIYENVKKELEGNNVKHTDEEERILKKFRLEGRLNGLELNDNLKGRLMESLNKLSVQRAQFKQKYEVSTKQFKHLIRDGTIVRNFPIDLLKQTAANPNDYLKGPWMITLQPNCYLPTLEHCPDREIRWNLWQASVNRGSGYNSRDLATGIHLEEIRSVRRDIANTLGFNTFADMSMETKMAGNVDNVNNIINMLLKHAKPAQDRELDDLYKFAIERSFKGNRIELWDLPYWKYKQQKSLYNYNEEELQKYFPLPKVLDGLFQLCENLFNIKIRKRNNISTWHKDVSFYDIFETNSVAPIAGFYIDPYVRSDEKNILQQNNGWMISIQNQSRITDTKPLSALIFNFEPPSNDKPSYLTFKQVDSLFHKFGLALQHLLTKTNYSEVSGFSNIEWDAVEICGHVLSHFLYNKTVMENITQHCDNGDSLSVELLDNLIAINKQLAGVELSKELYLSTLDLELHQSKEYWLDIVKRLWPEFRSFPLDKLDSHPCSFTQIFTEEWGAAYYSHIWSRMIAADVYSAFDEVQDDDRKIIEVGRRFRDTFLMYGGSCHPGEVFRKFRGRDPSPKALLISLGLKQIKTEQ